MISRDSQKSSSAQEALSPEAPFLIDFFEEIHKPNLEYCVERNYERLPYNLYGGDIDLLISEKHRQNAIEIILSLAIKHNALVQILRRNSDLTAMRCFGFNGRGLPWVVPIDLHTRLSWEGIDFYDATKVLQKASYANGKIVANPDDAAIIAFLKELLYKKKVPNKYWEQALRTYQVKPSYVTEQLKNVFGEKAQKLLSLFRNQNIQGLETVSRDLRQALLVRSLLNSFFSLTKKKFHNFLIHCQRFWIKPGVMVAVLGPDGVGKTTLIEGVRHEFDRLMHVDVPTQVRHWRPHLLPRLARLFGRKIDEPAESFINPHAGQPSGALGSILRLAYYTIDYVLGYLLLIYPVLGKYPTVIFFDRYYYDYFVDPSRWKVNAPKWAVDFFGLFVPHPDLVIILTADLSLIHQRKPELPLDELYQQAIRRQELTQKLRNVVWIDNSGDIQISEKKMLGAVFTAFAKRVDRRCPS